MMLHEIIFYLLLIDSVGANLTLWFGPEWYARHFNFLSRWFPATPGWPLLYLALVLYIGYLIHGASIIW
jgi:hypothetical protein